MANDNLNSTENFPSKKPSYNKIFASDFYEFFGNILITQKENINFQTIYDNEYDSSLRSSSLFKRSEELISKDNLKKQTYHNVIGKRNSYKDYKFLNSLIFSNCSVTSNNKNIKNSFFTVYDKNKKYILEKKMLVDQLGTMKPDGNYSSALSINCLMNSDIRQSHQLWNTSFGKKLINGKASVDSNIAFIDNNHLSENHNNDKTISKNKNFETSKAFLFVSPPKTLKKDLQNKNIFISKNQNVSRNKKSEEVRSVKKKKQQIKRSERCNNKNSPQKNNLFNKLQKFKNNKTTVKKTLNSKNILKSETRRSVKDLKSLSIISRNQFCLSNHIRKIFNSNKMLPCDFCDETFPSTQDLLEHLKIHQKENCQEKYCLLCSKVFSTSKDLTKHLLSHENIDKFICKLCKKYFTSSKIFKQHCEDFHYGNKKISTLFPIENVLLDNKGGL